MKLWMEPAVFYGIPFALGCLLIAGCSSSPEGEIHTIEGYVAVKEEKVAWDDDFLKIHLSLAQNPEKLAGEWWKASCVWWSEDRKTEYTEFNSFVRKGGPKVEKGYYYIIRYKERDPYNRVIVSARKPMIRNRQIKAMIKDYEAPFVTTTHNILGFFPYEEKWEKIPKPRVKPKEVSSSYVWPTSDAAPEYIATGRNAFVPIFTPVRVATTVPVFQTVSTPRRTVVIRSRSGLVHRSLLFR